MAGSDSSDCVGFRKFQREAESHSAALFVEKTGAQEGGVSESPDLQFQDHYNRGELHLNPCDWGQFLQMKQRAEDRYDLVDSLLVSRVGMTRDYDSSHLISALFKLINQIWIQRRHVEAYPLPNVRLWSPREVPVLAAGRKAVRGSAESRPSSSSGSERGA